MPCTARTRRLGIIREAELKYIPGQKGFVLVENIGRSAHQVTSLITGARYTLLPGKKALIDQQDYKLVTSWKENGKRTIVKVEPDASVNKIHQTSEAEKARIPLGISERDAQGGEGDNQGGLREDNKNLETQT